MKIRIGLAFVAVGAVLATSPGLLSCRVDAAEEKSNGTGSESEPSKSAEKPKPPKPKDLLRQIREASVPLLAEMAEKDGYRLESGQVLRRIAPYPFAERRAIYYRVAHPSQAEAIPTPADAMTFRWDGKGLTSWGMTFGSDYTLTGVLDAAQQIKSQEIEGPEELLNKRLPGDWVVRPGSTDEEIAKALESILRKEFQMQVRLEFRKRVRWAYVARGKYHYTPAKERAELEKGKSEKERSRSDTVDVFGKVFVVNSGAGGGGGDFKDCLQWVGRWIEMPIVNEVEEPPKPSLDWRLHAQSTFTKEERREDHDPELVLKNLEAQTGLTFTKEIRPIRRLMVEPIE